MVPGAAWTTSVKGFETKMYSLLLENPFYSFNQFFQDELGNFVFKIWFFLLNLKVYGS